MPKNSARPKVAMYGLTTEGYALAAKFVERADVTVVDETLQMALELNSAFLKKNQNLEELMGSEPLMSFKPIEQVLSDSQIIFFTPKLRRPSDESLIEASSKLRDLSKYIVKGSVLVNTLPTGPGGNAENIMVIEKQTGLGIGDTLAYAYVPLRAGSTDAQTVAYAGAGEENPLEILGFKPNAQNIFAAELAYASSVLIQAVGMATEVELMKRAREARVKFLGRGEAFYFDELAQHVHELRAVQSSEEAGESITYLAGAALKSVENYVRYVVDETREMLKEMELKASRTKVLILWTLDRYEMRGDRLQLAESISTRLKDYVTDVVVHSGAKLAGGSDIFDSQKHNVAVVCSKRDYEGVREARKGQRGFELSLLQATADLRRE
ncbi:MAG: hypothetical protein OK422_04560 [Thaumarchaeota archaeon]|nr:hypothetical protein [Nitrososphaerota archaeon]